MPDADAYQPGVSVFGQANIETRGRYALGQKRRHGADMPGNALVGMYQSINKLILRIPNKCVNIMRVNQLSVCANMYIFTSH